jgi:IS30 family transposase
MSKLSPELQEEVLARVAKRATYDSIVAWLKKKHRITITKQAISKMVRKHRSERADVAKVIARTHIEQTLPTDLAEFDRIQARNVRLLERAQDEANKDFSVANVEKVTKLTGAYLKADEQKKRALGLEQPDEVIADLATLLAKA